MWPKKKCYNCHLFISSYELIRCVRCQVKLHYECYDNNYGKTHKGYTQCPECHKIGTMGVTQKVIDNLNSKCIYTRKYKI